MAREIAVESFTVFELDELEPKARERAIVNVQTRCWWDADDLESVEEEMVYALAEALGTPGWSDFGEADFPGIEGVEVVGWDLGQAQVLGLKGVLTPENAPALPWSDAQDPIFAVHLEPAPRGGNTYVGVAIQDEEGQDPPARVRAMQDAVIEAMEKAKSAGMARLEWLGGTERAEQDILDNGREFTADGELYLG